MAQEEFEIEIRPNGEVSVRTIGFKGAACVDAAKQFLQMLKGTEVDSELTSEYYETGSSVHTDDHVQNWNRWE